MIELQEEILLQMEDAFASSTVEQAFLLGCTSRLDCLNRCCKLPAVRAGKHFYTPDATAADQIITAWGVEGVCFCGFIHSHVVNKEELSEADILFAKELIAAYDLPVLWFGLAIVTAREVAYKFYAVSRQERHNIDIKPVRTTSARGELIEKR